MTIQIHLEVNPYDIAEQEVGPCLAAFDIETYSASFPNKAQDPVVVIGIGHTTGLGAASKVYLRCYASPSPSPEDEEKLIEDFIDYINLLPGGTLCAHWGFGETLDDGFDSPYLEMRCIEHHPAIRYRLGDALTRWKQHDTCKLSVAPARIKRSLYDLEDYYGLFRPAELRVPGEDIQQMVRSFWDSGDRKLLHYNMTDVYNCLRLAQNQLKKHINPLKNIDRKNDKGNTA